ncbi:MAG: cation:proton antiporter [Geminicoccaceae bacterium]|nr:cation:proton antiporter [Geminicoccaceae bacterium]MCX8100971.1 cation:proton antiporter [Geminicoccaceae bacterium]MDW8370787.1 cation:proton antiporter [Geminicoccaceae bacterium]
MSASAFGSVFAEIAALLGLAALVGLVGLLLRQPLVVSFIVVGILAGPAGIGLVRAADEVELLAELGIAVLLFLVGLKLDLGLVRSLGTVALATGLGQVVFTAFFGFLLGLAFGMPPLEAFYVAFALTFSSTIIIVKLLSDKREIDSLHGRVALGFLIVQDIVVVLAMIVLSALGVGTAAEDPMRAVLLVVGAGGLFLAFVLLFVRFLADPLTERLARTPELLLLFAVALAAGGAAVADALGLGKELGGLMAGVALASTPYRDALSARLSPLRDFLLLFFFVALGSRLDLAQMRADLLPAIAFSLFVLVGNPLIVLAIMGAMGFRKRTGFLAGLTVAQISEFSLVFVAMGVSLGHVGEAALGLTTLVGLVTIAASTYMIIWSHELYALLAPLLRPFERRETAREPAGHEGAPVRADILLLGLGRLGSALASRLLARGLAVLAVDFDPLVVRLARRQGLEVVFGDASDPERLASLPLATARWVVVALPGLERGLTHEDPRKAVLQALRATGFAGKIAVVARSEQEESELARLGADVVLVPFEDAADRAVELLVAASEPGRRDAGAPATARATAP